MPPPVRCLMCGQTIRTHELLLVVAPGSGRTSSLEREPLLGTGEEIVMHRACGLQHHDEDDIEPGHTHDFSPEP